MGNCLKCKNNGSSSDIQAHHGHRRLEEHVRRSRQPPYYDNDPILHPAPGISRPMSQLTEEEQVKIATRMGLISTLPLFKFDESKREKLTECIICMCEYEENEELRYLPCLHTYHRVCIDDWLMRSLTCPSCLEEIRPNSPDKAHLTTVGSEDRSVQSDMLEQSSNTEAQTQPRSLTGPLVSHTHKHGDPPNMVDLRRRTTQIRQPITNHLSSDVSKSSNNNSGGDGANVLIINERYNYHRRTRSNGHTHQSELASSRSQSHHRRGNSVEFSPTLLSESRGTTTFTSTVHQLNALRQLDGDSQELPFN